MLKIWSHKKFGVGGILACGFITHTGVGKFV